MIFMADTNTNVNNILPTFSGYLAEIVEVDMKRKTGIYGEIYIVSCKILEGRDEGRVIRKTMMGPIKVGDVVRVLDTNREGREIRVK
jgi:small subunit ribosomal protein S28e